MASWKSRSSCVLVVLCALILFGSKAVIIECEDEKVTKTIKPSKTGIAHASFCAEIRPPPEPYAELPGSNEFCFTHHLCSGRYFWWWEATEHDRDVYTIHLQIRNLGEQDNGEFPITVFTNRYHDALNLTVVVSDKGDHSEDDIEPPKETPKIEECADSESKAEAASSSKKCPSGWSPVADGLCLMNRLGAPVNFPLAKDSCAVYGATLVKMEKVGEMRRRRRRRKRNHTGKDKDGKEESVDGDGKEDDYDDYDEEGFYYDDDEEVRGDEEDGVEKTTMRSEEELEGKPADERDEEKEEKDDGEAVAKEKNYEEIEEERIDDREIKEGEDKDNLDTDKEEEEFVDEEGGDESLDDGIKKSYREEEDIKDLEVAEREKGQEERVKAEGGKITHIERIFLGMEKADDYAMDKCLDARLTVLAGSQRVWVLDEEDALSCLTYNTERKLIQEERSCHYLYNTFTCLLDTRLYKKPSITNFHLRLHHAKGHHKDIDLSVKNQRMDFHEVKEGMTHAIISCEADGWPKPEVVIVEEAMGAQPQTLHSSPHRHNISDSSDSLLGRFSCVASNIFGDEAKIGNLQLWRYEPPHRVRLLASGLLTLLIFIIIVTALIIMNRYKIFKPWGRCHAFICSCSCFYCPRRRPAGASRVPTEIFPPSQDYVYGDVWADDVPLYVRQARVRTSSNSGPVYKNTTEEK